MKPLHWVMAMIILLDMLVRIVPGATVEPETAGERYTCGQATLFAIARLKGIKIEWPDISRTLPPSDDRTNSFAEIEDAAVGAGLHPIAVRMTRQRLTGMLPPAILHFAGRPGVGDSATAPVAHFAVAVSWNSEGVVLLDPPRSAQFVPWVAIEPSWTGNAMLFADSAADADRLKSDLAAGIVDWILPISLLAGTFVLLFILVPPTVRWRKLRPATATGNSPICMIRRSRRAAAAWMRTSAMLAIANWRRWLAIAAVLSAIIGGTAAWSWARRPTQPRLETPAGVFEQGFLEPGDHTVHVKLKNSGGAPLVVSKIESSCSCAVPANPSQIRPGETGELEVVLHGSPGSRFADLFVHSNDPSSPRQLTFHWTGASTPWLPIKSIVAEVRRGGEYHTVIKVAYPGGYSAAAPVFDRYSSDYAGVKFEAVATNAAAAPAPDQSHQQSPVTYRDLRLSVAPPGDREELHAKCDIFLKDRNGEQRLPFQVRLIYRSDKAPRPACVTFSAKSSAAIVGQERKVVLPGWDSAPKLRIASCPGWLQCAIEQPPAGDCELRAVVTRPPSSRFDAGTVVVANESGSTMQLRVAAIASD